jgi:hypothetical protein
VICRATFPKRKPRTYFEGREERCIGERSREGNIHHTSASYFRAREHTGWCSGSAADLHADVLGANLGRNTRHPDNFIVLFFSPSGQLLSWYFEILSFST